MKKVLLTLLATLVVLGLFAAIGFTGYRFGYAQGLQATTNGEAPGPRLFERMGPGRMPMHDFGMDRGFPHGFGMRGFPMMGFGFFSPFRILVQLAVLALIIWFAYWLFTRSGYQITRTVQTIPTPPTETKE
jgi:hypothetical protein